MIKHKYLFILFFFSANFLFAQNYNWITPNQTYLKMYVVDDGIYRINRIDFENAGINTTSIDPRTVKVYFKGNQIPIYFYGENDGVFDVNDYLDFFGQRNYGGLTNYYDTYNQLNYTKDEYFNYYSDTSNYWVGWGGANGSRYSDYSNATATTYPLDYYFAKFHSEKDTYYSFGENYSSTDYRNFSNDLFQGEGWYKMSMAFMNNATDTFSTPYKSINTQNCFLKIFAYPGNRNTSIYKEHHLVLKINNNTFPDTLYADDFNRIDTTIVFPSSYLNLSGANTLNVRYAPPSTFTGGIVNLDMVEILYPHRFEFDNNIVRFNSSISDSSVKLFKIKGFVSLNEINIYDVKNNIRIPNYQTSADTLIFSGKGNGNFEIVNKLITKKPFRIKQKQVPNYISTSNGVDYLIIYNKLFESQVEQLRQHRANVNGFRAVRAEIEDIYDIFNYGMEDPAAIRNFTKYIYDNWQTPRMKFLCLFGRGSLDPKKNIPTSQYYQNLVPVYGNPPTDNYFGNFNIGSFAYYSNLAIGRIPVISTQEAQIAVNKIIGYDLQPLDTWIKEPLFITSGSDRNSQIIFMASSEYFLNNYINPPPISSMAVRIYKNDSAGYATFNLRDSTRNSLNRGGLLANYIGHSGDTKWENCLDDPLILTNGLKLPLVFSMTCFTGRNSESNNRSFGEVFYLNQNGGSIGVVGTTGWSFSGSGNDLNGYLLQSLVQDTARYIGQVAKYANNKMSTDSSSFAVRNTLNCYNLIGDPASKLLLPIHPEFDIQLTDYSLSTKFPAIKENILLNINPKNLGTYADSCKIRYKILKFNQTYKIKDTVVHNFSYKLSLNYGFSIDTSGIFFMKVIIDPDNWYPADNKNNNTITFPIVLKNLAYIPLKPIDNMLIQTDTITFTGLNPQINFITNTVKVILEIDSTNKFNSPLKLSYFNNNLSGVVTKFKIPVPGQDTNLLYFWRTCAIINNDSSGWSEIRRFYYKPNNITQYKAGEKINFKNNSELRNYTNYLDTLISIYVNSNRQFNITNVNKINFDSSGFNLSKSAGNLFVRSLGSNAYEASYFIVNSYMFLMDGGTNPGLNMLKVRKTDGKVKEFKNFPMSSVSYSDSVVNFLNTFSPAEYLMALNASYVPGGLGFNAAAKQKMREFGSVYADTIPAFGWFHTWSFIGFLGATPAQISEQYHPCCPQGWVQSISQLTPIFTQTSGSLTQVIGPAQSWKSFSWEQILYPNSNILFDIYGINKLNQQTLLYQNLNTNNLVSLDTLNAFTYPNLRLITKLNIDTVSGFQSPIFKSMKFKYYPPAELAIDSIALYKPEPIINDGDEVKVNANYYNVGYRNAYGVASAWFVYNGAGDKIVLKSDTLYSTLQIDSMKNSSTKLIMHFLPGVVKKPNNMVTLYFEVKALGQQNDYYDYNNIVYVNLLMKDGPSMGGKIDLFADGVKLQGGEYVKQKPELTVKITNNQNYILSKTDSTNFRVYINNTYFPFGNSISPNPKKRDFENKRDNSSVTFFPEFKEGDNEIKFVLKTIDGINFDTVKYSILVSNEFLIRDLVNYPNPMKNETDFLFTVTGINRPSECKIKIYSVSGRLVKTISSLATTGYNQVHWDGRDNEGDYMANGVYFYKMIIDGELKKETSIQKLVILK